MSVTSEFKISLYVQKNKRLRKIHRYENKRCLWLTNDCVNIGQKSQQISNAVIDGYTLLDLTASVQAVIVITKVDPNAVLLQLCSQTSISTHTAYPMMTHGSVTLQSLANQNAFHGRGLGLPVSAMSRATARG